MDFYSARLIFVILINDSKPKKRNDCDEAIYVFKADDLGNAFERALELGKAREHTYENCDNRNVRWAFVEVAEVRRIGETVENAEVSSKLLCVSSEEPMAFDSQLRPEDKAPYETPSVSSTRCAIFYSGITSA